jgi:hypothetical protein
VIRRTAPLALVLAAACSGSTSTSTAPTPTPTPTQSAARFSAVVDNPWFPLKPGARYVSTGHQDSDPVRDVTTVDTRTTVIDGAPCVIVHDLVYVAGVLEERTLDYYTQDDLGNVWYFGEDTAELDPSGKVTSREGTWRAGVKGATAGVFMPAAPAVGQHFRQEYFKGHAEDEFTVIRLNAPVSVPGARSTTGIVTEEHSRLEPTVFERKVYVRGIGVVLDFGYKGANERLELISYTP